MVVYKAPEWKVLLTQLPSCNPTHHLTLDECQLIKSYKPTVIILFTEKKAEQVCTLVTMDIGAQDTDNTHVTSYYSATSVTDVALYTEPEDVFLMKKNGAVSWHKWSVWLPGWEGSWHPSM